MKNETEITKKELLKRIKAVSDCKKAQYTTGNYRKDKYMRGLANGLVIAEAILNGVSQEYIEAAIVF